MNEIAHSEQDREEQIQKELQLEDQGLAVGLIPRFRRRYTWEYITRLKGKADTVHKVYAGFQRIQTYICIPFNRKL